MLFRSQRFGELAGAGLRELGERAPAGRSFTEYFDRQPAGKPSVLSELRRDADVVSVLVGARVQPQSRSQKQQYAVSSTTLMLLRGKVLSLSVYGAYEKVGELPAGVHYELEDDGVLPNGATDGGHHDEAVMNMHLAMANHM